MTPFFPLGDILNLGIRAGTVLGNNLLNRRPVTQNVAESLFKPSAPIIIQNPKKQGLDALGIGFIEKNLIILGVFGLGAVAIWKVIK